MTRLRLLLPGEALIGQLPAPGGQVEEVVAALADLYAYPDPVPAGGWVRANMVSSLDGSATGDRDRSESISGSADKAVFGALRGLADVVLVGAGTARAEHYRAMRARPQFAQRRAASGQAPAAALAVVTRSGRLPEDIRAGAGQVVAVTCASADVAGLRRRFGTEGVLVAGDAAVDPRIAVAGLARLGLRRILLEGGPTLLGEVIAADLLDELCLTLSPLALSGEGPRIAQGPAALLPLRLAHLIEADGALIGRWVRQRPREG